MSDQTFPATLLGLYIPIIRLCESGIYLVQFPCRALCTPIVAALNDNVGQLPAFMGQFLCH